VRGGKPQRGLELLDEVRRQGMTPRRINFRVAIAACARCVSLCVGCVGAHMRAWVFVGVWKGPSL
jgi:hypothetical protein